MKKAIALNDAIEIINTARRMNSANLAIWTMLHKAQLYLEAQMTVELHTV